MANRIPPPLLMLIVAAAMWFAPREPSATSRSVLAAAVFMAAGVFGLPALAAFRRSGTTIDPLHVDRASALVTSGIYRITRNPMYVALTLMLAAWALWLGGVMVWAGPVFLVAWLDRLQIRPEEQAMTQRFGDEYRAYQREVRRWL